MSWRAFPLPAAAILACLSLSLGCATSAGSLYRDTAAAERRQAEDREPSAPKPQPLQPVERGLEVESDPDGASVYLNNRYVGETPLLLEDLAAGRYQLRLELKGYYPHDALIDYAGAHMVFRTDLRRVTGFLQVDVEPPGATIRVADRELPAGAPSELPAGVFGARVMLFGYEEHGEQVRIEENALTRLSVRLQPASLRLENLGASRAEFNPDNPGLLGRSRLRFRVSSFGTGRAAVLDSGGREVWRKELERFTTWEQVFDWDGRASDGSPLPDGPYTLLLEAVPETAAEGGGEERLSARLGLALNRDLRLSFRPLWNGSSGLLFAPSPETLPPGSLQVSTLLVSHVEASGGGYSFRTPWDLGLRLGLRPGLELDLRGGAILGYGDVVPWLASAAVKVPLSRGPIESTALARLAYQGVLTDSFASFTGLTLGLPLSASLGAVRLFLAPELTLSLWEVSYTATDWPDPAFSAWAYLKAGVALSLRSWILGLSASARTLPFRRGLGFELPLQAGLEAHWMIPGTQAFLTAALTAEVGEAGSFYLSGGGGLGLLD